MAGKWRALDYHIGTQHPDGELMRQRRPYLPSMRPVLFKRYRGLPSVELKLDKPADGPPALSAIGGGWEGAAEIPARSAIRGGEGTLAQPNLDQLARLLHYSAGITKHLRGYAFRAAACTGALYHIELYLVCGELNGLPAGVYHYDPEASRLLRLREGDWRGWLSAAAGTESVEQAPATLVCTDVYWRNAIKYQAREYRHAYWDSGTLLANSLAMANALELSARLVMGFIDAEVGRLLGIELAEELPLALVALGESGQPAENVGVGTGEPADQLAGLERIRQEVEQQPEGSRAYPIIPRIHRVTSFDTVEQVRQWRERVRTGEGMDGAAGMTRDSDSADGAAVEYGSDELELQVPPNAELPDHSLEQVIVRRGSSRAFARAPITAGQLAVVLDRCQPPISTDYQSTPGLVQPYLIANAVDGLAGGIYQVLGRQPVRLRQIRSGEYRTVAAQLALGQALGGDAAVNLYFMSPLEQVLERFGERGYRIAQMEAAIAAGRGYLAAYALGIGATGLTFFDELVEQLLDVTDQHLKVMFLLAVGVPFNR